MLQRILPCLLLMGACIEPPASDTDPAAPPDRCRAPDCRVRELQAGGGAFHSGATCATDSQARLWCWGASGAMHSPVPRVVDGHPNIHSGTRLSVGNGMVLNPTPVCVHGANDLVTCYHADADRGQSLLGVPPGVPHGPVLGWSVGGGHACHVDFEGAVGCTWLEATLGELELAEVDAAEVWSDPERAPGPVAEVAAGYDHACARMEDGRVLCWGLNDVGQLGADAPDVCQRLDEEVPCALEPVEATQGAVALWAGGTATCVRRSAGELQCWGLVGMGRPDEAALYGFIRPDPRPLEPTWPEPTALETDFAVEEVQIGKEHACLLYPDRTVRCFGGNRAGQLGTGDLHYVPFPGVDPGLGPVERVAVGRLHTCVLLTDGELYCWGDDEHGQLGIDGEASGSCTNVEGESFPCALTPQRVLALGPDDGSG